MKKPILNRWGNDSSLDGLLFFAQRMEELLFNYTTDTYKAPALNTFYLCNELEKTLDYAISGEMKEGNIKPVMEELKHSILCDSVASKLLGAHRELYLKRLGGDIGSLPDLNIHVRSLKNLIDKQYLDTLKNELVEKTRHGKEKEMIDSLTKSLATHLINSGYHQSYLYSKVREFFFRGQKDKINEHSKILDFLNLFDCKTQKWDVLFKVNKLFLACKREAGIFKSDFFEKAPSARTTSPYELNFLINAPHEVFILFSNIEKFDPASAKREAERRIQVMAQIIRYHLHRPHLEWSDEALVYEVPQNNLLKLGKSVSPVHMKSEPKPENIGTDVADTVRTLIKLDIEQSSFRLFVRAINLHASAVESESPENQLINFWTVIEMLIANNEQETKITNILSAIYPILSHRYPIKLIADLLSSITNCDDKAMDIIRGSRIGKNDFEKLAAILMIKENEDCCEKLYSLFSRNPLLKNRIFKMHSELATPANIFQMIERRNNRIKWHLQRIYRCRNLIVHSGVSLPYLPVLVENIHSYVDRIFKNILETLTKKDRIKTIQEACLNIKFDYESHMIFLKAIKNEGCTEENYERILFGVQCD